MFLTFFFFFRKCLTKFTFQTGEAYHFCPFSINGKNDFNCTEWEKYRVFFTNNNHFFKSISLLIYYVYRERVKKKVFFSKKKKFKTLTADQFNKNVWCLTKRVWNNNWIWNFHLQTSYSNTLYSRAAAPVRGKIMQNLYTSGRKGWEFHSHWKQHKIQNFNVSHISHASI